MKLEEDNHVHIVCTSEDTIIKIQDQFLNENNQTEFIDLYKVKIYSQTLRERLLLQSIFGCESEKEMIELIEDQPNPCILYESYFELENRSLLTYLIQFQKVYNKLLSEENY